MAGRDNAYREVRSEEEGKEAPIKATGHTYHPDNEESKGNSYPIYRL